MNEAIRIAIDKGGYKSTRFPGWVDVKGFQPGSIGANQVLLDPLFWQALGKALGWVSVGIDTPCPGGHNGHPQAQFCQQWWGGEQQQKWLYYWHRYIDALAEGKEEEFWKSMTN